MKRRIISLLMVVCLLVSLLPTWALAEGEEPVDQSEEQVADLPEEGEPEGEVPEEPEGETEEEVHEEPPHEHVWEALVTEPTCTEQGYTTYTCACGESYTDNYVDPLNHPETEEIPEIPATCTEAGVAVGLRCLICGEIIQGCEEIQALGHTPEDVADVSATTEATGMTAGTRCAICGAILSGCEEIPMLEVTVEQESEVEPEPAQETEKEEEPEPVEEQETEGNPEATQVPEHADVQETDHGNDQETDSDRKQTADPESPILPTEEEEELIVEEVGGQIASEEAANAVADSGTCGESVNWEYDADSGTLTISGMGAMEDYNYDATINSSNAPWKDYYGTISSVIIETGVTSIGECAFANCSSLTDITIPESVETIGWGAFYSCSSLTDITIPAGVTSIEGHLFYRCIGLTDITIPDGITEINASAFEGCTGLTSIAIPDSVTYIGADGFAECSRLTSITIPDSVAGIGSAAFSGCSSLTSITVPADVTSIESSLFYECSGLTSITIPNGVTSIGWGAFFGCSSLTSVVIPPSVTSVEESVFVGCSALETAVAPSWIFADCPITSITIPDGVTSVRESAFAHCSSITNVTIPESVTSIGARAFYECSGLTSITIPAAVTGIGEEAFYGCSGLTSFTFPENVTSIGQGAFSLCSGLTSLTIPESVTSIEAGVFSGCSGLTSLTIPENVTSIGEWAFSDCNGLTSVVIPASVTDMEPNAFVGCSALQTVVAPFWAFDENVIPSFTISDGVTSIRDNAFAECGGLTSITIPEGVTRIGQGAFVGCVGLTDIVLPASLESIGEAAFMYCSGFTSLTVPESVTNIGPYAFSYCDGLTSITLPARLTSIGAGAFEGCSGLTGISLPDGITGIGDNMFSECTGLKSITIPASVKTIGEGAFFNDSALETVVFIGTEAEWSQIEIGSDNDALSSAQIRYEPDIEETAITSFTNTITGVKLAWKAVDGAQKYRVFRKGPNDSDWVKLGDTTALTYTDKNVTSGTKYSYTIKVIVDTAESDYAASKSITFLSAPTLSSVGGANGSVTVKWAKVTGAVNYRVFRKTGTGSWTKLADTTAVSYVDKTVKAGTAYSYTVRCVNKDGTASTSGYNTTGLAITYTGNPALSSVANNVSGVVVKWAKVTGAAKYRVFRKGPSDTGWVKVGDTTGISYTDKTVKSGTKYSYAVRCLSSNAKFYTGGLSGSKSVTYIAAPKVSSLNATKGSITIKWGKVTGAAKYRVLRKVEDGSWKKLADTTAVSYVDKTVTAGTQYGYTVRCLSGDGKTYTSAYDTTGKTMSYCDAPVISTVTNAKTGVTVKWSRVTGAEAYRVFRKTGSGSWAALGDTTKINFTDNTAESGVKYSYAVRCVTGDGKYYTGALSAAKTITFIAAPVLSSAAATSGKVTLKWAKVVGAEKYRVLRKTGSGSWVKLADTTSVSYVDKTAVKGTKYSYTVRCISADGKTYTSAYDTIGKTITAK